jgi:hypothetical protein
LAQRRFFGESWPLSRLRDALSPVKQGAEFLTTRAPVWFGRKEDPSPAPSAVRAGVTQRQPNPEPKEPTNAKGFLIPIPRF